MREAVLFYGRNLSSQDGEYIVNYLRNRKVPESMWKQFNLGASPNEWHGVLNYLKSKKKLVNNSG